MRDDIVVAELFEQLAMNGKISTSDIGAFLNSILRVKEDIEEEGEANKVVNFYNHNKDERLMSYDVGDIIDIILDEVGNNVSADDLEKGYNILKDQITSLINNHQVTDPEQLPIIDWITSIGLFSLIYTMFKGKPRKALSIHH